MHGIELAALMPMNGHVRWGLRSARSVPVDREHTAHISGEKLSELNAACVEEATVNHPSSLSGMVTPLPQTPELVGAFTTVCTLASGSTATVYLAVDNRATAAKGVAIKCYLPAFTERQGFESEFIRQMSRARALNHPCVCNLLDYGRIGSTYYTAMEFLEGEPLSKVLAAPALRGLSHRSPHLIAHVVANLAEGLHAIHTTGTAREGADAIHGGITANNLFVLYDGRVRVMNFGTAWIREAKQLAGDKSYLAPEQLEPGTFDAGVDIWSLGVVLWELLAGKKLFRCSTKREAMVEITARRISAPSEHNPQVTAELDRIVLKALARDARKRYGSARELLLDLEGYGAQDGGSITASAVSDWLRQLFPDGAARARSLLELAVTTQVFFARSTDRQHAAPPGRSADAHTTDDEVEQTTGIYAPRPKEDSLPSVELPQETVSFTNFPFTLRHLKRRQRGGFMPVALGVAIGSLAVFLGHLVAFPGRGGEKRVATPSVALKSATPEPTSVVKVATLSPSLSAASYPMASVPTPILREPDPKPTPAATKVAFKEHGSTQFVPGNSVRLSSPASAVPPEPGAVYVTTPGGADVYERGRYLGHAPAEFELSPGWHTLVLKSGNDNRAVTVQVPAGSAIMVSIPASK